MLKLIKSPVLRQYTVVIIANVTILNLGMHVVWPSPMLIKLRDVDQTPLSRPVKAEEEPWIVAISSLFGVTALVITGSLMNWLGRKYVLLLVYVPRMAMCLLSILASEVWMILVGRAIGGIADLVALSVVSTYASEVAGTKIRGASGTVTQIMSALGMMIMFSVGPFVSYISVNVTMTCVVVVTFIPLFYIPESPYFLNARGKTKEAEAVLMFLRGSSELASKEIKEYSIKPENQIIDKWSLLKDRTLCKTVGIVLFLAIGMQMIGYNAVNFYLQTIFESTKTSISSDIASLVIGLIQLIASICTFMVTDKFGRKPILCISLIGMALGMFGLGGFFVVLNKGQDIMGFLNYLPLISIIIIIFGFNAGLGSLFFILVAELFEGTVRPYGMSLAVFVTIFCTFLLTLFFPSVTNTIGDVNTYWMFGASCVFVCLFIFFLVPETKGRSFDDIQKALGRNNLTVDKA